MRRHIITLTFAMCLLPSMAQEQSDSIPSLAKKNLDEVVVKGKHTLVKMDGNAMVYKAKTIRARYAPSTAYDLLAKLPSITDGGNSLSLIGANNLLVVIDGKTVAMEQEHVYQQLKSLSADKVKDVEIYYNAPAQYHFNGAVINVVTTLGSQSELSLFLDGTVKQTRKTSTNDKASLLWSNTKITSLTSAGYIRNNKWSITDYRLYTDGTFTTSYRQRITENNSYGDLYKVSEDITFQPSSNYRVTFDYYGIFGHDNSNKYTKIWQRNTVQAKTLSRENTKEALHTAGVQVDLRHGWTLGARYKSYVSPFTQRYVSGDLDEMLLLPNNYLQESNQDITNVKASIDKIYHFTPKTSLSFGFTHQYNRSTTQITADDVISQNRQTENIEALYAQTNFMLFKRINMMLGVRGEYIKSYRRNLQTRECTTLWDEFTLFPTATLGMPIAKRNFLQFQLVSQKQYPSFWAVSPETTLIDERTIETGNTELKPSRVYDASMMFIIRQKWFFILGCTYTPDYFANIPHQEEATGMTVHRYENYDFSLFNNLTVMHPMNFGKYNGRISAHVLRMQDKMRNFYGTSFNNEKWVWAMSLNNTYRIPLGQKWGSLFLEANFRYQAPAIQGIYRLSDTYALDTDVRWNPTNRISMMVALDNILRHSAPNEFKITTVGQESIIKGYNTRTAMLRLVVNLGKKKEQKEETNVDTSRFGRK